MSERWIDVPVPEHLVGDVIRLISDHLDEEGVDTSNSGLPEEPEDGWLWWQNLESHEQRLLFALAARGGEEVDSWTVAEELSVSVRELGGVVGPLNKRMRQDRMRPPVRSRQATVAGRRVKRMGIEPGYLPFIGEPKPIKVPAKRVPLPRVVRDPKK